MKDSKRKTISILLFLIWLSYGPHLYPMPWSRIANIPVLEDTPAPWLSKEENATIHDIWGDIPIIIWSQWISDLFIISMGFFASFLLFRKWKYSLYACLAPSTLYLLLWYLRHVNDLSMTMPGVPEKTLMESFFSGWSSADFLARYTGDYFHYFDFIYNEVAFPVSHICFISLCIYWIYAERGRV